MTVSEVLKVDSRVMQTIARYLETLKYSVDGDELHGLIARTLRRHSRHGPPDTTYLIDLYGRLDAYARDPVALPSMRIRARLLQQHIAPYITEFGTLPAAIELAEPSMDARQLLEDIAPEPAAIAPRMSASAMPPPSDAAIEGILERPHEREQDASTERTEKYQALLRSEKDAWQAIYGTVKDYHELKNAWMQSLEDLARQRDDLEQKLAKTTEHIGVLEAEHTRLRDELGKARIEPPKRRPQSVPRLISRNVARLNALPKRDIFVRQLDTEIKRIKRSGAPLALGLIGIDSLETLIERHGHEAAASVLRCYAQEILSNFRAYDMVALYEQDQFAVMFPDTRKEGARRALEKAYKRAAETHLSLAGESVALPPFAGALILYSAGEDLNSFLGRAGHALNEARQTGQTGVVMA